MTDVAQGWTDWEVDEALVELYERRHGERARLNRVIEDSSIAETARLNAEAERDDIMGQRDDNHHRAETAERERDHWRELARSRKDTKLVDTITALEAELAVAQQSVLVEGDRAANAEADRDSFREALQRIEQFRSWEGGIARAALEGERVE